MRILKTFLRNLSYAAVLSVIAFRDVESTNERHRRLHENGHGSSRHLMPGRQFPLEQLEPEPGNINRTRSGSISTANLLYVQHSHLPILTCFLCPSAVMSCCWSRRALGAAARGCRGASAPTTSCCCRRLRRLPTPNPTKDLKPKIDNNQLNHLVPTFKSLFRVDGKA